MALTTLEQPLLYAPAYNDQVIKLFEDDLASKYKFKYCIDVTVLNAFTGDNDQYLGRFKCIPLYENPSALAPTIGYFNLKEEIKRALYLGSYNTGLVWPIVGVFVQVGEEYSTTASGAATYHAVTGNDFQYNAINAALDINDFQKYNYAEYVDLLAAFSSTGIAFNALTTYTGTRKTLISTYNELLFIYAGNQDVEALFKYYNGATLLTTETLPVTENAYGFKIETSAYGLNLPIGCTRYTVQGKRVGGGAITPVYDYEFADFDCEYDLVNVYFQSKWGAIESYVTERKSYKNTQTKRELIKKNDRYLNTYSINDPASQVFNSLLTNKHTINSDFIEGGSVMYSFLSELVLTNRAAITFDKDKTITAGTKAQIRVTFSWLSGGNVSGDITILFDTPIGSRTFTVPDGTPYDTFADDFITGTIIPILESSNLNDDYIFSASLATGSDAIVLITAKNVGQNYTFTDQDITGDVSVSNKIDGENDTYVPPTMIPVIVENDNYQWTKDQNNNLFQLNLNLIETSTFERQYK